MIEERHDSIEQDRPAPRGVSGRRLRPGGPRRHGLALLCLGLLQLGCGTAAAPGPGGPGPASGPRGTASSLAPDIGFGPVPFDRVVSERFKISIPLPEAKSWSVVDKRSSFLVLRHGASASELVVRLWREDGNMNREGCEAQARLRRDMPQRAGRLIDERRVDVPPGFDTVARVGLLAPAADAPAAGGAPAGLQAGYILAFGGWARDCFAYVYTTQAAGAEAEQILEDRLASMLSRSLEDLELRRSIAPAPRPH
ncbi:MAG: hypothetical protein HY744_14610 [Deltaproteobacteria bacterium]|nr:hypothetical protein [Deltaproteobacteria bacterium]